MVTKQQDLVEVGRDASGQALLFKHPAVQNHHAQCGPLLHVRARLAPSRSTAYVSLPSMHAS